MPTSSRAGDSQSHGTHALRPITLGPLIWLRFACRLDALEDLAQGVRLLEVLDDAFELGRLHGAANRIVEVETEGLGRRQLLGQLLADRVRIAVLADLLVDRREAAALDPYALRVGACQVGEEAARAGIGVEGVSDVGAAGDT